MGGDARGLRARSSRRRPWSRQWPLDGWQSLLLSGALLAWIAVRAARAARSPLEVLAPRLHGALVDGVRRRADRGA